jgi:hypothetical protein
MDGFPTTIQMPRQQSAVIKWTLDDLVSYDTITLAGLSDDTAYEIGTVLGKISVGSVSRAAKSGGNTGNGTLTLDVTTPELAGVQTGIYPVRCKTVTTGTPAATGAARTGNTGNATIGTVTPDDTASLGEYRAIFTGATTFDLFDPNNELVAAGSTGVAYSHGGMGFTITAGNTPCVAGDEFVLIVTDLGVSIFSVVDPNGTALPDVKSGATYATQLKFVIAEGNSKFHVGDGFDITVAKAVGNYVQIDPQASDGSQNFAAILAAHAFIPASTDVDALGLMRDGVVLADALIWPDGITDAQIAAALEQAAAVRITTKLSV